MRLFLNGCVVAMLICSSSICAQGWPTLKPAEKWVDARRAPILAAVFAGGRIVAVGDHGVVLLSDDTGRTYRQAMHVPTRTLLTSVYFLNEKVGWAAGHDGIVLHTEDGGERWELLRHEAGKERPILSIWFENERHGMAVGLFSMAIETRDGGRHWKTLMIGDSDKHFYHVLSTAKGTLLVLGEAGTIYRSADGGKSWQSLSSGGNASLWSGIALKNGTILICGMRGNLYRSLDDGIVWERLAADTHESLAALTQSRDGKVYVVGSSGTILQGRESNFTQQKRSSRVFLTAVLAGKTPVFFSMQGPLR